MAERTGPESEQVTLQGLVERVVFRNESTGWSVLRVAPPDGRDFTAAGPLPAVAEGDTVRLTGSSVLHPRFGQRFEFRTGEVLTPDTLEALRGWLSHGRVKGVGPATVDRIISAFGQDTFRVLEEEPDRVAAVRGVGKAKARRLTDFWRSNRAARDVALFLQRAGLGPALQARVLARFGLDAPEKIRRDPWELATTVDGIGFPTADRVALVLGADPLSPRRLAAALTHGLAEGLEAGHLHLGEDELLDRTAGLLDVPRAAVVSACDEGLARRSILRIASPGSGSDGPVICLPFLLAAEREVAARLLALAAARPKGSPRLSRRAGPGQPELSEEQARAVDALLGESVAILTGGPGVGKTTVLGAVAQAWERAGLRMALACPTGRAARRLSEAAGRPASTLHRLLRFQPREGTFGHDEEAPLPVDGIIIDEASMLEMPLCLHLLRALRPGTRILFVGDPDQLPPVGPGQVLSDMIASGRIRTERLTRIFRQLESSLIVRNAHGILEGRAPEVPAAGAVSDFYFFPEEDPAAGALLVRDLVVRRIGARFGFRSGEDIQVLTPMHKGDVGATHLNALLQDALTAGAPELVAGNRRFRTGDRVMQIRNDYDLEIWNGDIGRVAGVFEDGIDVCIDGVTARRGRENLGDVDLAFAITIHKSQGSEFPAVVLPVYPQHAVLLDRNLLYTAVTRARRLLVVVGSRRALHLALSSVRRRMRRTGLAAWLRGDAPIELPPHGGSRADPPGPAT